VDFAGEDFIVVEEGIPFQTSISDFIEEITYILLQMRVKICLL